MRKWLDNSRLAIAKEQEAPKAILIAIMIPIFATFYGVLADVSDGLANPLLGLPPNSLLGRLLLPTVLSAIVFIALIALPRVRRAILHSYGFASYSPAWFPPDIDSRHKLARSRIDTLIDNNDKLIIASISGEWDFCNPINRKQMKRIFEEKKVHLQVLLAHPLSDGLTERCRREPGQDLNLMRSRIVDNTKLLLHFNNSVEVRWYLGLPIWHIIASGSAMHFSPFVIDLAGHDSPRYEVTANHPLYKSFMVWFQREWEHALPALQEIEWVERDIIRRRTVFLDRDDTIVSNVCYFGDPETTKINIRDGVIDGLHRLATAGFRLIVVSNQHPVGLKLHSKEDLEKLSRRIKNAFKAQGIYIDAFYYCTHTEGQQCNCRKPGSGLFERARKDFGLRLADCHFIGDSQDDEKVGETIPELTVHIVSPTKDFSVIVNNILQQA